ncbi:hypothetical protein [Cupriavidus sp. UYPR2.512]|uniref:hypothetical protein n=1 Tax=Cupriavidus sp. UYPR2.512 TaxID=1080187 RepID=UPI00037C04C4|nr:hypothetical protein [Cupriavidus sp. UYPR2.512]UIF89969.1 hypothetical protein KAF44_40005 [Cupriavidus necator]
MFWGTGSLASKPKFDLGGWSVVETDRGEHHLVGIDLDNGTGQVSSTIVRFDASAMRCETVSGRIYTLQETEGIATSNAWYVWEAWCQVNDVKHWTDVTARYRRGASAT